MQVEVREKVERGLAIKNRFFLLKWNVYNNRMSRKTLKIWSTFRKRLKSTQKTETIKQHGFFKG